MALSDWTPLQSSNVAAVAYDADKQQLHVRFKNGATYAYHGANQALHDEMVDAASAGAFVRGPLAGYDYTRIS